MRVLIVDDSAVVRSAVSRLLEDDGHVVITARDGVEAIQTLYRDPPDLVLLDIHMPKVTGYVVCRLVKEDEVLSGIPVLFLTARDSAEARYWSRKSGADGYLTKDALGEELVTSVRAAGAARALAELSGLPGRQKVEEADEVFARVAALLDRKLFEMTIASDIADLPAEGLDVRETLGEALFLTRQVAAYETAALALVEPGLVVIRCDVPLPRLAIDRFRNQVMDLVIEASPAARTADDITVWRSDSIADVPDGTRFAGRWESWFTMPLRARGEVVGILAVAARQAGAISSEGGRALRMIEQPLARMIESATDHGRVLEREARRNLSSLFDSM